jgi:hypothetical protein
MFIGHRRGFFTVAIAPAKKIALAPVPAPTQHETNANKNP